MALRIKLASTTHADFIPRGSRVKVKFVSLGIGIILSAHCPVRENPNINRKRHYIEACKTNQIMVKV